jgi:hypothetical protein
VNLCTLFWSFSFSSIIVFSLKLEGEGDSKRLYSTQSDHAEANRRSLRGFELPNRK